jgi:iron complex transport system substrate-binding protein
VSVVAVLAGCSSGSTAESAGRPAAPAQAGFPVTIDHGFGSTTIPSRPQRVLTIGFNEQDFALAFGVEPVGVREFLGYDAPKRPWAPESVRGKAIPTVGANELNFEKIAGLRPDLILGINSYIDKAAYQKLSAIAPTVAQSGDVAQGATSWEDQTLTTGKALGETAKAQQIISRTRKAFADARKANPSFAGKSATFGLGSSASGSYSLGADDYRTGWLTDLGFTVPRKGQDVSFEKFGDVFDTDVVLAEGFDDKTLARPLVKKLPAVREGRFVELGAFDQDFAAALGFNSPLSIPYLLKIAVPRLAAAADGDPKTVPEPYNG